MKNVTTQLVIPLQILIAQSAVAFSGTDERGLNVAKINTCTQAAEELRLMFQKVPERLSFNLGKNWVETDRLNFDIDRDGAMDSAVLMTRTFDPVFESREAAVQAAASGVGKLRVSRRAPIFLVVWLSNKKQPKTVLPRGTPFTEAKLNLLVQVKLKHLESGANVFETHESVMLSAGGWGSKSTTLKWRFENETIRLIGRTEADSQRNTRKSKQTDENLTTGAVIETEIQPAEANGSSKTLETKRTLRKTNVAASKIYLSDLKSCDVGDVWMLLEP